MKNCFYLLALCLGFMIPGNGFAKTIERLTPPLINASTIKKKIACTRPMRAEKFNISVEDRDGKVLVHCYGHGGSGCTTVFGSVSQAIELFEGHAIDKDEGPIVVIGGGIIGLTTAIELSHRGYAVSGIFAKELYDIPSWKNAGYFALVSVQTSKEEEENLHQIGMNTFKEYQKIHDGKHPYIGSDCVRLCPVYCSDKTEAGVENLEKEGLIPPRKYVTLDFGNGVIHENFVKYFTYFMDTTQIMLQLRHEVDKLGIPIIEKEIFSFNDLKDPVVFNCSGIGAKELNSDEKMIPVRGHLVNLNENAGDAHLEYMIYTKVKDKSGDEAYVYMFPKCLQVTAESPLGEPVNGTLGGTFIPIEKEMTKEEFEELDRVQLKKMLERNTMFFWGKPSLDE